jgi:hypothetical protein
MEKNRSDLAFERFLTANGFSFRPVPTGTNKTPDYGVLIGGIEIVFEIVFETRVAHGYEGKLRSGVRRPACGDGRPPDKERRHHTPPASDLTRR